MTRKIFFTLLYWFKDPPWDTGITPPEVYQFLADHPPGRALDLGCGTGTNVITLAKKGWQAAGVDFIPRAIRSARRKARREGLEEQTDFYVGDILSPEIFQGVYDLILDIGCFHGFSNEEVALYAQNLPDHLRPGGSFLLYTHLKEDPALAHGASEADLSRLGEFLELVKRTDGQESSRPSAWLEFKKAE